MDRNIKNEDNRCTDPTDRTVSGNPNRKRMNRRTRVEQYYEIHRMKQEIYTLLPLAIQLSSSSSSSSSKGLNPNHNNNNNTNNNNNNHYTIRIAIQMPDELLHDGPLLCQVYDEYFRNHKYEPQEQQQQQQQQQQQSENTNQQQDDARTRTTTTFHVFSIYLLGDSTMYNDTSCCPDIISAQHIQAHFLIHYGHACLSSFSNSIDTYSGSNSDVPQQQQQLPIVLYSFGPAAGSVSLLSTTTSLSVPQLCAKDVHDALIQRSKIKQQQQQQPCTDSSMERKKTNRIKILLLYEVQYYYMISDIVKELYSIERNSTNDNNNNNDDDDDRSTHCIRSIKIGTIPQFYHTPTNQIATNANNSSNTKIHHNHNDTNLSVDTHVTSTSNATSTISNKCNSQGCCNNATVLTTTTTTCCSNTSIRNENRDCNATCGTTTICTISDTDINHSASHNCRTTDVKSNDDIVLIKNIQHQYQNVMVGGLLLPYPFSNNSRNSINNKIPFAKDDYRNDDNDDWIDNDKNDDINNNSNTQENDYILLYIGQDTSRPFFNIALRFLSMNNNADNNNANRLHLSAIWTWSLPTKIISINDIPAATSRLCTNVLENSISFQRILHRRYYLIQKAKQCTVFGIIIAYMTPTIQSFVANVQEYLKQQEDITYYTFVIGKINPTKLANFPEVQCFILIACPEHSLLHNERELYHVPIITPYELLLAFGDKYASNDTTGLEWGATPYSTYPNEYWNVKSTSSSTSEDSAKEDGGSDRNIINDNNNHDNDDDDDEDAPYFSLVSGKYEARPKKASVAIQNDESATEVVDTSSSSTITPTLPPTGTSTALTTRVGNGTMMQYTTNSAASHFFKQREYQGLVPMQPLASDNDEEITSNDHDDPGTQQQQYTINVVQPAVMGQSGIASNYQNR